MSQEAGVVAVAAAAAARSESPLPRAFTISGAPSLAETVREVWAYRELLVFLAWRDITIRYRQTLLGASWALLQPLATMAVFAFLFGRVVKVPTNGLPVPLFYLSALLPWIYFSTTVTTAGNSLLANSELIKKVYFPRIILPASGALIGLMDFAVGGVVLVAMIGYYDLLSWRLLLWIPLTALLWLFGAGVAAFLAAVSVRYRDVKYAIPFLIQIWLFVTPVIYPMTAVPPRFAVLLSINPLSGIIEAFRATTTPSALVDWPQLGVSALLTAVTLAVSFAYFRRAEGYFTDVV
jgi:lipopolysaccharide transport system permease protein